VRHAFGIDDAHVLMATALRDAIEDTPADFDDQEEHFGRQVAE
jgi:(p)ppGpp synthase/HD superfamily hydrolase